MKEAKKALYQNAVIPELLKIKDELNRWLAPKFGEKLCIEFDFSVIPELQEETDKVVEQLSKAWWITPNEKRAAMSYGKDEQTSQLDDYFIPANLIPIKSNDVEMPVENIDVDVNKFLNTENVKKKEISERLKLALQNKIDEHNDEVGDDKDKRTTISILFQVYERGIGAYRTNPSSVRPSVSSPEQWAMARVNSFLYALRNGKFRSGKHDTDLLPDGHPMSSKEKPTEKNETFSDYPQTATNNAKRMIEWREKYGDEVTAGTATGWRRASMLANREPLTIEMLNRIKSFFARHEGNQTIAERFKDTPWRDNGFVSWNLWGGTAMRDWVNKKLNEINE